MRLTFCCFLIFITSIVYSQEPILDFKNLDFKRSIRNVENYSLADSKTNNLAIILGQKEKVSGYLYDADFQKIGKASGVRLKRKYKETIGYIVTNETTYTLVYGTSSRKKFGYLSVNLKSGEITSNEIEFKFDDERYLETILYENRMIMMSATKGNALILREFTSDFTFEAIATFQFDAEDKEQRLLERGFGFLSNTSNTSTGITKIDNRVPNTIERSSSEKKLYHQGDNVYFTFEDEESHTILNTLDLSSLELTTKTFSYPKGRIDEFKNFNSFIHGENFFHIASSRDEMIFQVKNFDNEVLKEFYVAQEDSIEFKNSPIIQDGSAYRNKKRELSTTKQYLRKITSGNIGVSIHKENEQYQITLGSHALISRGGGGYVGAPMGPVGGTTVPVPNGNSIFIPAYNPAFTSYGGYGFSKAVFVNSLFDSEFNHIKDETFENNIFDRVKEYQDELKWDTAEDVFIHNGKTYFSYWNTKEQHYFLIPF